MRVTYFGRVTAILAIGLGATTSIEIEEGTPSTDQYTDKTAMAQIGSWATPTFPLESDLETILAQTEAQALQKYTRLSDKNVEQFYAQLSALVAKLGVQKHATSVDVRKRAKKLLTQPVLNQVFWKVHVIDKSFRMPVKPKTWGGK